MKTLKQECQDCNGTGLYSGMCEPKGTAVVCLSCDGRGWLQHQYNEFIGRKKKCGIKTINYSRGAYIVTGMGAVGKSMTYAEFEEKIKS